MTLYIEIVTAANGGKCPCWNYEIQDPVFLLAVVQQMCDRIETLEQSVAELALRATS